MTNVYRSFVIGHKFINPIYECGIKQYPDINSICDQMGEPCPEVFNIIEHLYVSLLSLEIDLLTLSMGVGLKLPSSINPKCGQIGRPCTDVSKKV